MISKALEERNLEQLDLLLQAGVSPDITDATGKSPLQRAYLGKNDEICIKLVAAGADYENTEIDGMNTFVKTVADSRSKLAL